MSGDRRQQAAKGLPEKLRKCPEIGLDGDLSQEINYVAEVTFSLTLSSFWGEITPLRR